MYESEFRTKAWKLPVTDLLYVGSSTGRKLRSMGINTIGELALMDEGVISRQFGKMGTILWAFANGYDESPVKCDGEFDLLSRLGTVPQHQEIL